MYELHCNPPFPTRQRVLANHVGKSRGFHGGGGDRLPTPFQHFIAC